MNKKNLYLLLIAIFSLAGVIQAQAQEKLSQDSTQLLFDDDGSLTQIKNKLEDVDAKIIKINPRKDDVVWRRTILRVVDLRELQNRPLYLPAEDLTEETQKNLFAIIFSHILDSTLKAYKSPVNPAQTFVPKFTEENLFNLEEFLNATDLVGYEDKYELINYLTPGVVKYYVQEVWYFNKATSTFHNKILAIAPFYDERYNTRAENVRTSVYFWVSFDHLRPFLQEEFLKVSGRNTAPLVDFDNFLVSRQFDSYIIKDYGVDSRDIDSNIEDPRFIRQEQQRIEAEILDFEQDLWHY